MTDDLLSRIDEMIAEIERYKIEPQFSQEVAKRKAFSPENYRRPADFLRLLCHLIAYSQGAKAALVPTTFPVLEEAFAGFNLLFVAEMNPDAVVEVWGDRLGALRFRKQKIKAMVRCGAVVRDMCAGFANPVDYIGSFGLLSELRACEEVPTFWVALDAFLADLGRRSTPFFNNTTSLCHLLMVMGFPCNKPDSAVMSAASELEIVPVRKKYPDDELRLVVKAIQEYGVIRAVKPAVLDLYFLIRGGQSGTRKFLAPEYYAQLEHPAALDPQPNDHVGAEASGNFPPRPPIRSDTMTGERRCVEARRWRARPATVTIGETVIEGTVVDESDDQAVIFMPWGDSAEYLPFRIGRESVCVHPWNSPHARIRAFRQVAEAVLGRQCWLRVQTIAGTQGDAQERVTEIGRIFFGDNWARNFTPQIRSIGEVLRIRQSEKQAIEVETAGLAVTKAKKIPLRPSRARDIPF